MVCYKSLLMESDKDPVISPGASPMAVSSKDTGAAGIGERNFHPRKEIELMVEDKL